MFLVVNNRGQYVHRIWRSLTYLGVEAKIVPNTIPIEELSGMRPEGVVLSGGPHSVYRERDSLGVCEDALEADFPVLGICLGHQVMALHFGGEVSEGKTAEYAKVDLTVIEEDDLFRGLPRRISVWESHKDEVVRPPEDFIVLAASDICKVEAMKHRKKPIYGVQFHPEVEHTPQGMDILKNFIGVCKCR